MEAGKASAELMFELTRKKWFISGHINSICFYLALFHREAFHVASKVAASRFIDMYIHYIERDLSSKNFLALKSDVLIHEAIAGTRPRGYDLWPTWVIGLFLELGWVP